MVCVFIPISFFSWCVCKSPINRVAATDHFIFLEVFWKFLWSLLDFSWNFLGIFLGSILSFSWEFLGNHLEVSWNFLRIFVGVIVASLGNQSSCGLDCRFDLQAFFARWFLLSV